MTTSTPSFSYPPALLAPESVPLRLRQRIQQENPGVAFATTDAGTKKSCILYLPQINLRFQHNPAFAWACYLANACQLPLVVLAVVLDDSYHSGNNTPVVVATARRTAFVLEALQAAASQWSQHGAGVAIRVLAAGHRTPHQWTLARRAAAAVVTDTPFVCPYRTFVERLLRVCTSIPLYTVDGSTTVPPGSVLRRSTQNGTYQQDDIPTKAWQWEKRTQPWRRAHVVGAVREGQLDAPALLYRLEDDDFFLQPQPSDEHLRLLQQHLPNEWKDASVPCPGQRPWTVAELAAIPDLKAWVLQQQGIDASVPPCVQTHGAHGMQRWHHFRTHHLHNYAKRRNTITQPHAVSRLSCYLNYGCVSIFQVIHDLWEESTKNDSTKQQRDGCQKYASEIIKWREIGYVHCFARSSSNYINAAVVIPRWARQWWDQQGCCSGSSSSPSPEALAAGTTPDPTWNAMQQYLVTTGELHNNARMTWGKTVVHWQLCTDDIAHTLAQLIQLNDRYALDGLSPPSYAGILWCFGWCDKPGGAGGAIAAKSTARYRFRPHHFEQAQRTLLRAAPQTTPGVVGKTSSKGDKDNQQPDRKRQRSIDSYFRTAG